MLPKALPLPGQALREHRDVSGGWLRPAVFGAMDGLVTNSSLIAGVGGGGGARAAIVLTGIAGLIAGAFSMATGEYISVTSQNELTAAEVELERMQHRQDRAGKLGRLTEIYMDKGVSPNLAEAVARQISADEDRAVATHVREELGIDPEDLPSPRTAAAASFAAFTVGALLPLSPFLLGVPNLRLALVIAGIAAIVGGAAVAKLTDRSMLLGGLRQFIAAFLATGHGLRGRARDRRPHHLTRGRPPGPGQGQPGAQAPAGPAGDHRQQDLELAALAAHAADARGPAVRGRDRAHQGKPEPGPPRPLGAARGAEPVEDAVELAGLDAAAGIADGHPDLAIPAAADRQLDDVAVAGVPDRVLHQRVHREAEPLRIRQRPHRVERPELPLPRRGRPPPGDAPRPRTRPA